MTEPAQRPNLMKFAASGMEFILTFGLLLAGGILLDNRLGTMPAFTLVGGALGFSAAMYRLVREARQAQRDEQAADDRENRDKPTDG
jgi:F0F1-type ATP synthase assembly protein I